MIGDRQQLTRRWILHGGFWLAFLCGLSWHTAGAAQEEAQSHERLDEAVAKIEAEDREQPPPRDAVLFIGSSTIRRWVTLEEDFAGIPVINHGFGGSTIADCTRYIDRLVVPCRPKMIVLHAGSNDIAAGRTPEQVCADFRCFVQRVRMLMPDVPIAFVSINPTPLRWGQQELQAKANQLIEREIRQGRTPRLTYIDIWTPLLNEQNLPRRELHGIDRLHPNAAGYELRTQIIKPFVQITLRDQARH